MTHPVLTSVQDGYSPASTAAQGGNTPPGGGDDREKASRSASKPRAELAIPTDRIKFDNQVRILRSVASTSAGGRAITADAMSAAIGLSGTTGGLNSKFFQSANWFIRTGRGEYTASPGAIAWNQHLMIDPNAHFDAAAKLRDEVVHSWFWKTLAPLLSSGQPVSTSLALLELAKAAGATDHRTQLEMILQWLEWVGLVDRTDEGIRLRQQPDSVPQADEEVDGATVVDGAAAVPDAVEERAPEITEVADAGTAAPDVRISDPDAVVSFNLSVRLTAENVKSMNEDERNFILELAARLRG